MTRARAIPSIPAVSNEPDSAIAPPRTLDALRALSLRLGREDAPVRLGPKARHALAGMIELQGDPALLSITALADKLAVNPSTLSRLARNLGYANFGALQTVLLSASLAGPGQFYTNQARAALEGEDVSGLGGIARLCRESQANIDRFLNRSDAETFRGVAAKLSAARRVRVHGIRQFHAVASFLVYGLGMIRSDVALLDAQAGGTAEGLAAMGERDVLVSTSCNPYSAEVVETAKAAAEQGIEVIALTDHANSPLLASARLAILAPHETSFLSNSLSTFIVAAECIINGCAAIDPERSKRALQERDRMIKRLLIEL
ncbi:MurR/RpiR family transcriptional regulator [Marivita sp. GX14005]|uniref:MurR/RpiR family transcriptional regulator n=1 Tax=Marivita sp. GX14005 TaxID=2942276 RepID=UPI002019ED94|nr:MurR/RpiR family transcriptional regulator [Marivita sp. GX14005]MCL3882442.1 MurR/RpiR family transcriptional regulator [Marivita sp. GX14005]